MFARLDMVQGQFNHAGLLRIGVQFSQHELGLRGHAPSDRGLYRNEYRLLRLEPPIPDYVGGRPALPQRRRTMPYIGFIAVTSLSR